MKLHLFTFRLPHENDLSELNALLASERVASVEKSIHSCEQGVLLTVLVETTAAKAAPNRRSRIDYKELLNEAEFQIYSALRAKRKTWAAEENIPVFHIYSNEQLATIVRSQPSSKAELLAIPGVGESRWEKYGERTLAFLQERLSENQ